MIVSILISVAAILLGWLFFKAWSINQYWKKRNVPHLEPTLFFGNMFDVVVKRRTQDEIIASIYAAFPEEPIVGYYHFMGPRLIVRDIQQIERVLIKDFKHFMDRVPPTDLKTNALNINLFGLTGNTWRALRTKFSPMFTTGKLRDMLNQVTSTSGELVKLLDKNLNAVDIKEQSSKFALDIIASCAFGIEPGALDREDNEFKKEAERAFKASPAAFFRAMLNISFPALAQKLKITFLRNSTTEYFSNVVRDTLNHRRESSMVRNDFVQLMVTLQKQGTLDVGKYDPNDEYLMIDNSAAVDEKIELTDDILIGQSFVFLLAGFESTSTAMTFACYHLSLNRKAQEKAREEVKKIMKDRPEVTYDCLKDMKYVDHCLKESLRLYAAVGSLVRMCVLPYTFPGTDISIEPGMRVMIPAYAIHRDSQYYADPEEFVPERWESDEKRMPCTYLPFGDGPRICIGMRFAQMEIKCFLAKMLMNYRISLHPSVELPIRLNPHSFLTKPIQKLVFNLEKLVE
ncbi:cytochrome P450 [Nesidiocoris tenuis]|uniref:Cytochrome P450 n=1 Tax=Nesidiocoris tenuis TaxID=355587 RepID=A0ABN7B1Q6_9HEMI|nr:cytochrome P450 [Nesidiocoris tenuis]